MKTRVLYIFVLSVFLLAGCAANKHIIGYDITEPPIFDRNLGSVSILSFDDERPIEEREGLDGELLSFRSKDEHFTMEVSVAVVEILASELNNAGFLVVEKKGFSDYRIQGSVKHFQAVMTPSKVTFLPYVGSLAGAWVKDEFNIALSIYIKMTDNLGNTLIDKTFDVSEDFELSPGLLSLARYKRGFNYKLKLLDEALKDVMGQIRDEIIKKGG